MKVFLISTITLLFISLSDILFCQEKRMPEERAPLYSEFVLGVLCIFRILQIPLVIYLGFLNWKALIIVFIISFLGMRLFIDAFVERFIIIPAFSMLFNFLKRKSEKRQEK